MWMGMMGRMGVRRGDGKGARWQRIEDLEAGADADKGIVIPGGAVHAERGTGVEFNVLCHTPVQAGLHVGPPVDVERVGISGKHGVTIQIAHNAMTETDEIDQFGLDVGATAPPDGKRMGWIENRLAIDAQFESTWQLGCELEGGAAAVI